MGLSLFIRYLSIWMRFYFEVMKKFENYLGGIESVDLGYKFGFYRLVIVWMLGSYLSFSFYIY